VKVRSKIGLFGSLMIFGVIYLIVFISQIQAGLYHKQFVNDSIKKVVIEIKTNYYITPKISVEVFDLDKIDLLHTIFAKMLENRSIKEKNCMIIR